MSIEHPISSKLFGKTTATIKTEHWDSPQAEMVGTMPTNEVSKPTVTKETKNTLGPTLPPSPTITATKGVMPVSPVPPLLTATKGVMRCTQSPIMECKQQL